VKPEESEKHYQLQEKLKVTDREVADRVVRDVPANEREALQLANDIERTDQQLQYTLNYKRDANYDYWQTRADFEQTTNALEARRLMYEAKRKMDFDADTEKAKALYDEGFARWRAVIDEFPSILDDEAMTGEDLVEYIKDYRDVLTQREETIPDDFPLWEVIENFDTEQEFTEEIAEHKKRTDGESTLSPGSAPTSPEPVEPPPPASEPAPATPEPPAATPAPEEPATATPQ
jgi:hypothetical protein